MTDRKARGEVEPMRIRRIGYRHCIVTPQRETQLVDINRIRLQLEQQDDLVARLQAQLKMAVAQRDQTSAFLLAFDAQAIDRIESDPAVPLEEPKRLEEPKPEPAPDPSPGAQGDEPADAAPAPRKRGK